MKNVKELRVKLTEVFNDVVSLKMDRKVALVANGTAGRIISTVKVQLEYHKLRKSKPEVDFLKCK